jgi:hypothetical protein
MTTTSKIALILLTASAIACGNGRPFLLKYGSARRISVREHRNTLLISGATIHSGACVDTVKQQRKDGNVTLVVSLVPADGHCSGEYFVSVARAPDLQIVKLGIPGSQNPDELGVIWSRSLTGTVRCPPVCMTSN